MKDYKKLLFSFLALSLAWNAKSSENTFIKKYDSLYTKIVKNISDKKKEQNFYKTIEEILNKRNSELRDLYKQNDYIVKPEYLEWQIFFGGFYNVKNKKFTDKNDYEYGYSKVPMSVNLGMYIPMKDVLGVSPADMEKNSGLTAGYLTLNDPGIRNVNMFSAVKPDINLNVNPFSLSMNLNAEESETIKLQAEPTPLNILLDEVEVFNLQMNYMTTPYSSAYLGPVFSTTLGETSPYDIIYRVNDIWNSTNTLVNNGLLESRIKRKNAVALLVVRGSGLVGTYGNLSVINLENSNTAGAVIQPYTGGIVGFDKTTDFSLINTEYLWGTEKNAIIGQKYSALIGLAVPPANGVFTKQVGMGYIPTNTAQNIQVRMENFGDITMLSPNSTGFLLMPDIDIDPGSSAMVNSTAIATYDSGYTKYAYIFNNSDQMNVRQRALNAQSGTINVYGSRSYGFMTSPYAGDDTSLYNFGISTESAYTSSIANQGTINVLGDESTGFAIKKAIHLWSNEGEINVGNNNSSFLQDNDNGNTIYDKNGNLVSTGNQALVERATGMYTNQPLIAYSQSYDYASLPGYSADVLFGLAENSAKIILWNNAVYSSGIRAEKNGYILNRGEIIIKGENNYGMVVADSNSFVYNVAYTGNNQAVSIPGNDSYVAPLAGREARIILESTAGSSVGGFVQNEGNLENASEIIVNSINSSGLYIKSGNALNSDRTNQPKNHNYGQIIVNAAGTNGVLLTNEDEKSAVLINNGLIETKQAGTIAVYAVNGSLAEMKNLNEQESHYTPGDVIVNGNWAQNAAIKAADGATGLWLEQSNTAFSVSNPSGLALTRASIAAPVITGSSTSQYTSVGVYSDGIATAEFKKGIKYDLNPTLYANDTAAVRIGKNAVALLQNYKISEADSRSAVNFAGVGGTFDIQDLEINMDDNSVMAYSNGGKITTNTLGGIHISGLGSNTTLTFVSNNGSILINDTKISDFLMSPGAVTVGTGTMAYLAENGTIENQVIAGTEGLALNTDIGMKAYSKTGTSVSVNKANTNVINNGIITMKNNSAGAAAVYIKYGSVTNNGNVVLTDTDSAGLFAVEESDVINNGSVTAEENNSAGIYALSDDTGSSPISGASGINIKNSGIINVSGNDSAGIYAKYNGTFPISGAKIYDIKNLGTINVYNTESVGIYSDNVKVSSIGTINLNDVSLLGSSPSGNRIAVYGTGNNTEITGGGTINLGTADQTNIAYYLVNGAKLRGTGLGTITGYGVLVYSGGDIDNTTPDITASDGQIALVVKGGSGLTYAKDIKTGDTVNTGTGKYYAVALYTDGQAGAISNDLYAGADGIGLYAAGGNGTPGSGSILIYNGQITIGGGTEGGTGIYVNKGSNVNLNSGNIILNGSGSVGAYVESNGEFTFGSGSSMTFSSSGIGIWGENGAVINDNGGTVISLDSGATVIRSRIANGIINIVGPVTTVGNSITGYVVSGEINNMGGSLIEAVSGSDGTVGIAAEDYKTTGANPYEANNFGTIDLTNAVNSIGISVKNARAYNDTVALIKAGEKGIGIYGEGSSLFDLTELRNNGTISLDYNNSAGIYSKGASYIENNGAITGGAAGVGNIGIYGRKNSSLSVITAIINNSSIILGDNGIGIYAENSDITNNGSIVTGSSLTSLGTSAGIYAKDSTVTNNGNISIKDNGIAFAANNTTVNLNGGNIDDTKGSLVYAENGSVVNYSLGNRTTGENPYIYLNDSVINFISPTKITVSDNGTGIFAAGSSAGINGSLSLDIADNGTGIYLQNTGLYTNSNVINLNGQKAWGAAGENTDIANAGDININGEGGTGIYSVLTASGAVNNTVNTGKINVSGENSTGIYAVGEDSSLGILGQITVNNNGEINLGSSLDSNKAKTGIYGDKAVIINNNRDILGASGVIGIYSDGAATVQNGKIVLGDASTGIYSSGGTVNIAAGSEITVGNNRAAGVYAVNGSVITNNSSNVNAGENSVSFYIQDNGSKITNFSNLSANKNSTVFYLKDSEADNQGNILANGEKAVIFYGLNSRISNSGVLDAQGNSGVTAIYSKNSAVLNTGDIIMGDSIITDLSIPANNNYSVGIYGDNSIIENSAGTKITAGENAVGIYSKNNSTAAVNYGIIESSKYGAIGMFAENGTIQNDGTIILSGDKSIGMAGRIDAVLINNGVITLTGDDSIGIYAIANSSVENNNTIELHGNNSTGILMESGSQLINSGTINLYGNVTNKALITDGNSGYILPSITNAGVINVEEKFEADGIKINIKVDPSSVRTPTVSEISAFGYTAEDVNAKFLISDAVQFKADSFSVSEPVTVMSDFSQGTNSTVYKLENVFNPRTSGGINSGMLSVLSESLTWNAIPNINSQGNVDIWMQKLDYTEFSAGKWYYDFAEVLDSKYEDASGNALKIYDKIDKITKEKDFDRIMESLGGNIYSNINQREEDIAEIFDNSLALLQNSSNNTKENVKINIITGAGKTGEKADGVPSYDYESVGVLALREVERTYRHTYGYSLGYLHTNFDFDDGSSSKEEADTLQAGIHNKYTVNDWKFINNLTGRATLHNTDRNIDWTDSSGRSEMNGTYETYSITIDNIAGREFQLNKNISVMPYGALAGMYVTRPSFEESGLEALEVKSNDAWSVKPRAGMELKASVPLGTNESWKLKGNLDLFYEYELADLNKRESAKLLAVEENYHKLAKPDENKGRIAARAAIGVEMNDRYGIFLTGAYSADGSEKEDYRAGVDLKIVF